MRRPQVLSNGGRLIAGAAVAGIGAALLAGSAAWACTNQGIISLSDRDGPAASEVRVTSSTFFAGEVEIRLGKEGPVLTTTRGPSFNVIVRIPADAAPGYYFISATQPAPNSTQKDQLASRLFEVTGENVTTPEPEPDAPVIQNPDPAPAEAPGPTGAITLPQDDRSPSAAPAAAPTAQVPAAGPRATRPQAAAGSRTASDSPNGVPAAAGTIAAPEAGPAVVGVGSDERTPAPLALPVPGDLWAGLDPSTRFDVPPPTPANPRSPVGVGLLAVGLVGTAGIGGAIALAGLRRRRAAAW